MVRNTTQQLYALTIPEVQKLFLESMNGVVSRAVLDEMVQAIENNDVEALFRASGFTPAVLSPILDRLERVYKESASNSVDEWPNRVRTPFGLVVPFFDARNFKVEQELRDNSSRFISKISNETRNNIRSILEEGMIKGDNPRTTALNIVGRINPQTKKREGGVIGLSENQTRWSLSSRRYLETLDNRYFTLTLRDKRFDKTVQKAIKSKTPLNTETIGKLVSSYNSRALKYRADAISRTETLQAINRGERASLQQAIDEGYLKIQQIGKYWDDTGDLRVRDSHANLAGKYNSKNTIPFDEPFLTNKGNRLLHPGDTSLNAGPEDLVHCRCTARYIVDWRYQDG